MRAIAFMVVLSIVLLSTVVLAGDVATEATRTDAFRLTPAESPASKGPKTEVPGLMNYQGTLTDEHGMAMDTTVSMAFSIYTDSTGGSTVWTETQPVVIVSSGVFNVLLGNVNSISDTVFKDPERWLGIQVGGDAEMTPRQRIAAVGYAFWAAEADTAGYAKNAVSDGDWVIIGDDLYSNVADQVNIISTTKKTEGGSRGEGLRRENSSISKEKGTSALNVESENKIAIDASTENKIAISAWMLGSDDSSDARAAVKGSYFPTVENMGSGYGYLDGNYGVVGANAFGDNFSFGVAGYSENLSGISGGVFGAELSGSYWGALGYRDLGGNTWGVYTPNNSYLGGDVGIGTVSPDAKLHAVTTGTSRAGYFRINNASNDSSALYAETNGTGEGVYGQHSSSGNFGYLGSDFCGVGGYSQTNYGVYGESYGLPGLTGYGVVGIAGGEYLPKNGLPSGDITGVYGDGWDYGVYGHSLEGTGVYGSSLSGKGVYGGSGPSGYAGYFVGDLYASRNVGIGTEDPTEKLEVWGNLLLWASSGELILRTEKEHPSRFKIRFDNNSLAPIVGNDSTDQVFGFYTDFTNARAYDARLRIHGSAAASWNTYLEMTHDGTDGFLNTDVGDIVLNPAGNVGIGTTTPSQELEVEGEMSINSAASSLALDIYSTGFSVSQMVNFETNQNLSADKDMLQIRAGSGTANGMQFIECERGDTVKFKVEADGNVYADGSYSGPADFSEMIAVSSGAQTVEPGDVMVIDPRNSRATVKASVPRSTLVAGIYSTRPGFLGSERDWDKPVRGEGEETGTYTMEEMASEFNEVPLAVVGIVPCKASAENGSIHPGDLLVTSGTPGHAMRDDDPKVGTVLGKALESLASGTGLVKVLVTLH